MKHRRQSVVLAGLLALACGLTACSSMRGSGSGSDTYNSSGSSGSSGMSGTGTGTGSGGAGGWGGGTSGGNSGGSGQSGSSGGSGTSGSSGDMQKGTGSQGGGSAGLDSGSAGASGTGATAQTWTPNATVVAIEVVPRALGSDAGASESAMGSSGMAGSTGSSGDAERSGADRIYRVTLRLDDGSTAVITQESTPMFRSGDRVSLAGGMIQH